MKKRHAIITAFSLMLIVACHNEKVETNQKVQERVAGDSQMIKIDIYAKKACKATEPTIDLVKNILEQMNISSELNIMFLKSHSRAIELKVTGSPTIRVNGIDIDPSSDQTQRYGLT